METEQRARYDARLESIREANRHRVELEAKTEPELSHAALMSMAIYSAGESAS